MYWYNAQTGKSTWTDPMKVYLERERGVEREIGRYEIPVKRIMIKTFSNLSYPLQKQSSTPTTTSKPPVTPLPHQSSSLPTPPPSSSRRVLNTSTGGGGRGMRGSTMVTAPINPGSPGGGGLGGAPITKPRSATVGGGPVNRGTKPALPPNYGLFFFVFCFFCFFFVFLFFLIFFILFSFSLSFSLSPLPTSFKPQIFPTTRRKRIRKQLGKFRRATKQAPSYAFFAEAQSSTEIIFFFF